MLAYKRNKALITLLVLCFFLKFSFSQTVYSNKESSTFGFTVGLTSSDVYRDTINYEQGISLYGGMIYTLSITDKSGIGLELLGTRKKIKRSQPIKKYAFDYIDIPLYYQRRLSDNFKFDVGIQYSSFVRSTYDTLDGGQKTGLHSQALPTKMGNEFGILGGIEFGISKNLYVAARYTTSINSFIEKQSAYFGVFQFSFKYVVFRGHKQLFNKKQESASVF